MFKKKERKKNSINQSLGLVKYEDENCKGNMCWALSTSCPIKQCCSAVLPWRPHDFNSSPYLSLGVRERDWDGNRKNKNKK